MRSPQQIVSGDDAKVIHKLYKNGALFALSDSATVSCRLVSTDKATAYTAAVAQASNTDGADWQYSTIAAVFAEAVTSLIDYEGFALLETQVTDSGKQTWFLPVYITKGTIS